MSRVQLRGEPYPLLAAAGQRSVLNCHQSEVESQFMQCLSIKCDVHVNEIHDVLLKITYATCVFLGQNIKF